MFYEFHYWNIEKIINDFIEEYHLKNLGFEIKWAIGQNYIRKGIMAYRDSTKTIYFNPDRINQAYRNYPFFTPKEFIILAFIHELGHHIHWVKERDYLLTLIEQEKEANKRIKEVRYLFEKGAWNYGNEYVPTDLKSKFDLLNEINLQLYVEENEKNGISLTKQLEYLTSLETVKSIPLTKASLNKIIKWKKNGAIDKRKNEVIEEILDKINSDTSKFIERFYNDLIIHVIKDDEELRIVIQDMFDYKVKTVYKLTQPAYK